MDYILASLFALMVGAFAAHYHRLTARAQALSVVHTRLVQALNAHSTAIASSAQANPHLHFPVQNLLRKLRAIQTLGLPAVDQQMDVYDALWSIYHQNAPKEPERPMLYSAAPAPVKTYASETVGSYGDSDFLKAVSDMAPARAWEVMDELMERGEEEQKG